VPTLNIGINTGQPRRVAPTVWDIIGFFNSPILPARKGVSLLTGALMRSCAGKIPALPGKIIFPPVHILLITGL